MKYLIKKILTQIYRLNCLIKSIFHFISPMDSKLSLKLEEKLINETADYFFEHINQSVIFDEIIKIREYSIKTSLLNDKNKEYYYLEFGVSTGESANFFSNFLKKLYVFDSFEGLKEDWGGTPWPKGAFNLNKKPPNLNSNIEPVIGWVENSLSDFLKNHSPKINFVHIDLDTYNSTKFILEKIKPYLVNNCIFIFDEFYNYHGWKFGEYKAFKEIFNKDGFKYKAFNIRNTQCVVQIIKQ